MLPFVARGARWYQCETSYSTHAIRQISQKNIVDGVQKEWIMLQWLFLSVLTTCYGQDVDLHIDGQMFRKTWS